MRRCSVVLVLVAFLFSSGGQWTVLQCLAWANMIREYSQVVPLGQAVTMTFSGKYPCAMCKAIAEKRSSDDAKTFILAKHDKLVVAQGCTLRPLASTSSDEFHAVRESFLQFRAEAPPVPPPRLG
jgi:hypothetical protein